MSRVIEQSEHDFQWALSVIERASKLQKLRLRRGMIRRNQIAAAMEAGEQPEGPRIEWLKDSASKVLACLQECCRQFNEANCDDLISRADCVDALSTAINWLQKQTPSGSTD